jgi:hypothetical protein
VNVHPLSYPHGVERTIVNSHLGPVIFPIKLKVKENYIFTPSTATRGLADHFAIDNFAAPLGRERQRHRPKGHDAQGNTDAAHEEHEQHDSPREGAQPHLPRRRWKHTRRWRNIGILRPVHGESWPCQSLLMICSRLLMIGNVMRGHRL